jgi:U3 small nucleolar RNA-associated protein 21
MHNFWTVRARNVHKIILALATMVAVMQVDRADEILSPPRKRIRVEQAVKAAPKEPRLFAPFRALGLITNHVPFVLQTRSFKGSTEGPSLHLVTCLGKAWAMWEGGKMTLQFVGK